MGSDIVITNFDSQQSYQTVPIVANDSLLHLLKTLEGVKHVQRYSTKPGMIMTDDSFQGMVLKGVSHEYDWRFLKNHLQEGEIPVFSDTASTNKVLVSRTIADKLHLKLGDKIYTYYIEDNVRARRLTVAGIYQTNFSAYDDLFLITDLYTVNRLNGWQKGQVSGMELEVNEYSRLEPVKAGQNTQNGLLAKDRRQDRNTDVDVGAGLETCAEVAVLRDAVLGNVKVRHDFDTRDQRLVQSTLQRHIVDNDAVDAHTDLRLALERLDVNIRRRRRDGTLHEAVQQTDDGRVEVAALGSHVDGQILGLGGGHVAVVGGAGRLAGADLGVIVADGAAQRLQLGQHDLRFEAGQLADVLKGVVVQRVVGGNRQRARTLRNRQHIVLLRKLLRDLLNGGHIDVVCSMSIIVSWRRWASASRT